MRPALWFLSFVLLLFLLPALAAPAAAPAVPVRALPVGHEADRARASLYQPFVQDLMLRSEWLEDRRREGLAV